MIILEEVPGGDPEAPLEPALVDLTPGPIEVAPAGFRGPPAALSS